MTQVDPTVPVVIVSADSHVGPRVREDLRSYCPAAYLDDFDAYLADFDRRRPPAGKDFIGKDHPNLRPGHHDAAARLADMDSDGVAAEIIYDFSQNGEVLPWVGSGFAGFDEQRFEYAAVAYDIYNRWMADFLGADPKRLLGLVYIPAWDIDASVEAARWAAERGFSGVNFPACNRPGVRSYNDPAWDAFWSACVDHGLSLNTHANGGPLFDFSAGPGATEITTFEVGGYMSRAAAWHLVYGQVFDRFPELVLVLSEMEELWWTITKLELDSAYRRIGPTPLRKGMPSEYFASNIFHGASFMSPHQAEVAVAEDYEDNLLWGRDYPHVEGCFQAIDVDEPVSQTALRHVLSRVPIDAAVKIAGANGVRALGLDGEYLTRVAARIGAPTAERLTTAPESYPDVSPRCRAFSGQFAPRAFADEVMLDSA